MTDLLSVCAGGDRCGKQSRERPAVERERSPQGLFFDWVYPEFTPLLLRTMAMYVAHALAPRNPMRRARSGRPMGPPLQGTPS